MLFLSCLWLRKGIRYHQNRAGDHNQESDEIIQCQCFFQKEERKKGSRERCDGVVSAGFRGADGSLGADITKNAHAVGHEPQEQGGKNCLERREVAARAECQKKRTESGKSPLHNNDLIGTFFRELTSAVVFHPPADGCQQYQQRAPGKGERGKIFH